MTNELVERLQAAADKCWSISRNTPGLLIVAELNPVGIEILGSYRDDHFYKNYSRLITYQEIIDAKINPLDYLIDDIMETLMLPRELLPESPCE